MSEPQQMSFLGDNKPITGQRLSTQPDDTGFCLRYDHPNGSLYQGDSLAWLTSIESESVDLIIADPPYNIGKASWDQFDSQDEYLEWSLCWIKEAARVLTPNGTLYVCGFSEILADLKRPAMRYFAACRWIVWHYRNKANLGSDWGRSHESLLHFRKSKKTRINVDDIRIPYGAHTLKYPNHPQAQTSQYGNTKRQNEIWTPHPNGAKPKDVIEIPTTCNGMGESTPHPTQKPEELIRTLVLASSNEQQTVLDPFVGSGTTAVVSEQLNRRWLGCELNDEYLTWAMDRIDHVRRMSIDGWLRYDRKNRERRGRIR